MQFRSSAKLDNQFLSYVSATVKGEKCNAGGFGDERVGDVAAADVAWRGWFQIGPRKNQEEQKPGGTVIGGSRSWSFGTRRNSNQEETVTMRNSNLGISELGNQEEA